MSSIENILTKLLKIELTSHARKLQLVDNHLQERISDDFLHECIAALNELSLKRDETAQRQLIAIAALLWNYRSPQWVGLKNYLVLFLSRAGFGPSSIMLDPDYSHQTRSYSFGESIRNKVAIALAHLRYEIKVKGQPFLLTDFQKSIWDCVDTGHVTGISAPTSAGKSYLILLKSMELLLKKGGIIIYVVPTLSLVNQVMADFRKMLNEFGLGNYYLQSSFNTSTYSPRSVYILTQERAIAAFSQDTIPFKDIRLLVIDEIQNVERVENAEDQRSKVLYDLMMEFRNHATIDHIILSGPRIVKIDELGNSIFGLESIKRETGSSPVLNLTYSISKREKVFYLNVLSDLLPRSLEIRITREEAITGYGKVQYGEDYLDYLDELVKAFGGERVLIFSPTSPTCSKIAGHLARNSLNQETQYLRDLSNFIAQTVHPQFSLVETIKSGIAYHHGKLPFHVRLLVEDAIRTGMISTIVCTTTLLQGVNLPVQNIIIRNPNLFIKKGSHVNKLSNYELANLRGRAGRLLKDFIGRTFILDESAFKQKESNQLDLFKDSVKELKVGYGKTYQDYKKEITMDIRERVGSTADNQEYSYITAYLRQTVLRYGIDAQIYLSRVGISLSDGELNNILDVLRTLQVDRSVCSGNRYWDPVDLDALRNQSDGLSLPTNVFESTIAHQLQDILMFLSKNFPIYYNRYFKVDFTHSTGILLQKCILAESWVKEKTLAEILSGDYYDDSDKIDSTVYSLESTISYGLALLLKPLYDIVKPSSMFPRFIEMGAYKPLTRRFIELNIPRETAIFLSNSTNRFNNADPDNRQQLIDEIRAIRRELPIWYQMQLNTI
jgi:superfamily II DNA/RNA helicase